MKFLITEQQNEKIVEFVLNKEMPKKFDWWKGLKVVDFKRMMTLRPKLVKLEGVLTVDSEWAGEQCMKIYDSKIIDFNYEIDPALLSQIVTGDEADNIRDEISHILTFITGEDTFVPSLSHIEIKLQHSDDIVGGDVFESVLEETNIPLQLKRRVNNNVLDELIYTVKSLIDSGYDESDAIYDTVRQFIASKQFKLNNDSEQSYWDSYIEVEEPLVDYVKSKLNIQESILREETEGYKVNLVTKIIYTLYDNISFIKQSTFNGKPLLIIYFDSDDTAANIESWFDEKISRDISEWTSGNIVVCPDWTFDWDPRKKNADVFINTELIKYDNLGNVINESVLREESNKKNIRFKKDLKKYIDEYGLSDTKKILGMTTTDITKLLDLPINSELAYEILLENMSNGNLTIKYKEFTIYPQQWEGTVYWGTRIKTGHFLPNISEEITAIATPFWDGNEWTPIDIDDVNLKDEDERVIIRRGGEGDYYRKLEHKSNFDNIQELFTWYEEFYLPEVYNVVMNTLLPIVYQDIDDKLDERMSY